MNVGDEPIMGLTSVEKCLHVLGWAFRLLSTKDRRHELGDRRRVLFLIDHVVTRDQVWVALLSDANVVENLVDVSLAHHFVAGQNQRHLEVWHSLLNLVDDALNHGKLIQERHGLFNFFEAWPIDVCLAIE